MSEQIPINQESLLNQSLEQAGQRVPEIAANRPEIEQGCAELEEAFGVSPEFYEDEAKVMFFAALGQRSNQLEAAKEDMTVSQYAAHKEFIFNATAMLVGKQGAHYDEYKYLLNKEADNSDETALLSVYNKYKNKQVSAELEQAIAGGMLDDVKKRLGITPDNEDPYELMVLNLSDNYNLHGMMPTVPEGLGDKPYGDPAWLEYNDDQQAYNQYAADMLTNAAQFQRDLGTEGRIPGAWVTTLNGRRYLNVPLPVAEKLLYPEETRSDYYKDYDRRNDLAVLEHEYTHTQGGLAIDNNVNYGINFEERRAEAFSEDHLGYMDIKYELIDIKLVSGFNAKETLLSRPKGGTQAEFYGDLMNTVGLQEGLEISLRPPATYVEDVRPLQKSVAEYLGPMDAVVERLHEHCARNHEATEAADARVAEFAAIVQNNAHYFATRRNSGANYIPDLLEQKITALEQQSTEAKAA